MPSRFFRTFVNPFRRDSLEREVEDEISFHLEQKARDLVDTGVDPSEAGRRARAEFGPAGQWRRESVKARRHWRRRRRRIEWGNSWVQDLRHAVRGLARNPTLTLAAVSALALGIGANTAVYSVVHAVIFRPLPYPEPDRLVAIRLRVRDGVEAGGEQARDQGLSYGDFVDYRDQSSTLVDMAFMTFFSADFHGERPVRVIGHRVPASYFDLLGVGAALGRTLLKEDDDRPESDMAAVLTHAFWTRHLGADPDVVGRTFRYNSDGFFTIVGVMPEHFEQAPGFSREGGLMRVQVDLFTSFRTDPAFRTRRGVGGGLSVYARIAENRSWEEARAEVRAISAGLAEAYPDQDGGLEAVVTPLHSLRRQAFGRELGLLMGAAGLLLLIACADVGSLLLISGNERRREMAVRAALGSGRWRLIRLMMTEAFVLAVVGATVGVLLARWVQPVVVSLLPLSMPGANRVEIDVGVLVFATVLSLCTLLLFAVLPALRATRLDVSRELKIAEQSATGRSGLYLEARGAPGLAGHRAAALRGTVRQELPETRGSRARVYGRTGADCPHRPTNEKHRLREAKNLGRDPSGDADAPRRGFSFPGFSRARPTLRGELPAASTPTARASRSVRLVGGCRRTTSTRWESPSYGASAFPGGTPTTFRSRSAEAWATLGTRIGGHSCPRPIGWRS